MVKPNRWEKFIVKYPTAVYIGTILLSIGLVSTILAVGLPKMSPGRYNAVGTTVQQRNEILAAFDLTIEHINTPADERDSKCMTKKGLTDPPSPAPTSRRRLQAASCNGAYLTMDNEYNLGFNAPKLLYNSKDDNILTEESLLAICEFERKTLFGFDKYEEMALPNLFCACNENNEEIKDIPNIAGLTLKPQELCNSDPSKPTYLQNSPVEIATFLDFKPGSIQRNCFTFGDGVEECRDSYIESVEEILMGKLWPSFTLPSDGEYSLFKAKTTCELHDDWEQRLINIREIGELGSSCTGKINGTRACQEMILMRYVYRKFEDGMFLPDFFCSNCTGKAKTKRLKSRIELLTAKGIDNCFYLDPDCTSYTRHFDKELIKFGHTVGKNVQVMFDDFDRENKQSVQDLLKSGISLALVFLFMWYMTSSIFLTSTGMLEIVLSVPLGVFSWIVLLGRDYVDRLQILAFFIIFGIGADDIFVLIDAFEQSKQQPDKISGSLETRFAWAYRRAVNAMTVTSVTTFAAFTITGAVPIPSISAFGVFAAFVVLFDFLLVITLFAAAIVIHEKHLKSRKSLNTLLSALWSKLPIRRRKNKFVKLQDSSSMRPVELAFYNFSSLLKRAKRPIIAVFACILGVFTWQWISKLPTAQTPKQQYPDNHPITQYDQARSAFHPDVAYHRVGVFWGLDVDSPIDRSGVDSLFPADADLPYTLTDNCTKVIGNYPKLNFNQAWKTDTRQNLMQRQLLEFCENRTAVTQFTLPDNFDEDCWPLELQKHCDDHKDQCEHGFPTDTGDQLVELLKAAKFTDKVIIDEKEKYVKAAMIIFTSNMVDGGELRPISLDTLKREYTKWEQYTKEIAHGDAVFGGAVFDWIDTTESLIREAEIGIGVSLATAFVVVLLATGNITLALIAVVVVFGIMATTLGVVAAIGWEVAIIESVCMIVAVGLAIDYTVHLVHSYNSARSVTSRFEKSRNALTEMGVSVFSGGMTTALAAFPLTLTAQTFFSQFGTFVFIMICVSILWSCLCLMSITMEIGPEGKTTTSGDISNLFLRFAKTVDPPRQEAIVEYRPRRAGTARRAYLFF